MSAQSSPIRTSSLEAWKRMSASAPRPHAPRAARGLCPVCEQPGKGQAGGLIESSTDDEYQGRNDREGVLIEYDED
ncbi:hypothetical protein Tdes44962_MAKER03974 [Teratosphaeria destructans]|uniref:Uncharacterized protein n=1 Tax=Teratosphaeria destructans TaxID=418781 RepID=A0A9W7SP45_9PEZI|nr:hypothetical protein Tdes44962_MAKER03974 [Teratosphaeria destructans]